MPIHTEQKVAVIGLGYIGLPTAALIARSGAMVLGIDVSAHVVDTVNSGRVHIEEVDLDGLVQGVAICRLFGATQPVFEVALHIQMLEQAGFLEYVTQRTTPGRHENAP